MFLNNHHGSNWIGGIEPALGGKTDRAMGQYGIFHNEFNALWLSVITGLIQ
jgi:hypothetical protein